MHTPVDFAHGKIYKIVSFNSGEDDIYIGSTSKRYLSKRFMDHKSKYRIWLLNGKSGINLTVFGLFEKYGIENCKIVLIELFPCTCRAELFAREGYYIKSNICVNKNVAGRTKAQYCIDNKVKVLAASKKCYENNRSLYIEKVKLSTKRTKKRSMQT